jgi:hypothetical protein
LRYIPFVASLAAKAGVKLRKTPAEKISFQEVFLAGYKISYFFIAGSKVTG